MANQEYTKGGINYSKGKWEVIWPSGSNPFIQANGSVASIATVNMDNYSVKGNAALIAAAPVMYEALKAVLYSAEQWVKFLRQNVGPGQGQGMDEVFEKARAALSLVEGK